MAKAVSSGQWRIRRIRRRDVENDGAKLVEESTLQRLSEEITDHFLGWTIVNGNFTLFESMSNEVVTNVNVASAFAAGHSTIFLQKN